MGKNYWVSVKEPFAIWQSVLPGEASQKLDDILYFVDELLKIAKEEMGYEILEVPNSNPFHISQGYSYTDYLANAAKESQKVPLFDFPHFSYPTKDGQLRTPSSVCYYNKDGVVTKTLIEDAGLLLQSHNSNWDERQRVNFMKRIPPMLLSGRTFSISPDKRGMGPGVDSPVIYVFLYKDIWFPKVLGLMNDYVPQLYDNEELCMCHTPKLNNFLIALRRMTLKQNGVWRVLLDECHPQYKAMLSEMGIILSRD